MTQRVFISHASEDKDAIVRPLATELDARGVDVWYDEFTLRPGDSLRQSIEKGLRDASFAIAPDPLTSPSQPPA